jgi:hypothetical protein
MFIEEVVIDGFKSYATRTVVSGFDPSFNAITGLNGSGKSNILDSICFVLGISNLTQVRACVACSFGRPTRAPPVPTVVDSRVAPPTHPPFHKIN